MAVRARQIGVFAAVAGTVLAAGGSRAQQAVTPQHPGVPVSPAVELEMPEGTLVREGALVSGARGHMVRGRSGRWFFVFDADGQGRRLPAMVVQPGPQLGAMERVAARLGGERGGSGGGGRMLVTGQVQVYHGVNYLLATAPPLVDHSAVTASVTGEAGGTADGSGGGEAAGAPSGDPSIEQIVADLEGAVRSRRSLGEEASVELPMSPAPDGSGSSLVAGERTGRERPSAQSGVITGRRGRLKRMSDGGWKFVFDTGPQGVREGPLVVLPCQTLMAMEAAAEQRPDGVVFSVSGRVLSDGSGGPAGGAAGETGGEPARRFLLPTVFRVERQQDQVMPAQ